MDAATGYHRWSQRFDRLLDDVFAMQDEIAASVVRALGGEALSEREQSSIRRIPANTEAYEYYLRGHQLFYNMRRPSLESARRMYLKAIAIDELVQWQQHAILNDAQRAALFAHKNTTIRGKRHGGRVA